MKPLIVPPAVATSSPANSTAALLVVNVIVEVWPLVRLADDAVMATVGHSVSIVILGESSPARFASAMPLVKTAAATVTSPKPSKSCVGVNLAVYVVPFTAVNSVSVPLTATASPSRKSLDSWSRTNVIVAY